MAFSVTTDFTVDTTAVASQVNQNFTDVETELNDFPTDGTLKADAVSAAAQVSDGILTTAKFATNVVDTDGTLAANSDTRLASQKAIKTYVDARPVSYDSGWFAISTATAYTKAHSLGATPTIVQVWFSESSDGTGDVVPIGNASYNVDNNTAVVDIDATNVKLRTGNDAVALYRDVAGTSRTRTSGYAKIIALYFS